LLSSELMLPVTGAAVAVGVAVAAGVDAVAVGAAVAEGAGVAVAAGAFEQLVPVHVLPVEALVQLGCVQSAEYFLQADSAAWHAAEVLQPVEVLPVVGRLVVASRSFCSAADFGQVLDTVPSVVGRLVVPLRRL
jgi:hypothetical protein